MKTITAKSLITVLIFYFALPVNPGQAKDVNDVAESVSKDQFEHFFEQEELFTHIENQLEPGYSIKIYDPDGDLVASGSEDDENIKNLLRNSVSLTEVNGIGYYLHGRK